jgi:3-oxoacyl-[acyl-carrier-protein] synthase II
MAIVVSGLGLTTSLGRGAAETWRALEAGESGIRPIASLELGRFPVRDGGEAPALPDEPRDRHERSVAHLLAACREALERAGFSGGRLPSGERGALVVGSSLAASASSPEFWRSGDPAHLKSYVVEPLVDDLCRALGVQGDALLVSNACAAGASAVALAADLVARGRARVAIAAGFDALDVYTLAGFASLKALASGPSRPFGEARDGMKLGDGFAAIVLEPEERLRESGRRPVARFLGAGESSDAHHITHPDPDGRGAALAMNRALARAGLSPDSIDYVNAHATATGPNDSAELKALERVFGERLRAIPISATKPAIGHTLGGAGTVEAAVTLLVLESQRLPPTLGLGPLEPGARDLDLVPEPRPARVRTAMTNSFGFGGCNASLIFGEVGT